MNTLVSVIWSSTGRKVLNGLTGLFLCVFITIHLVGNLALYAGAKPFNLYAHFLESLGGLIITLEAGIVAGFLVHMTTASFVWISKWRARPIRYKKVKGAGGNSHRTFSSLTMLYTGILLGIFTVIHLINFKYGTKYYATYNGQEVRDLYRLVIEVFSQEWYTISYVVIMILLGYHLRHGFWSAFQSLGVSHPKYSPIIYFVGYLFAVLMALGFLIIPLWAYFTGGTL
jgi:succinate dehydrogenase / fumarate reductase cytochrome b subunit